MIMFEITTKWLDIHSTNKGGWTRKQAEILGFSWPLKKGWKRKIHGQFITNTDRVNFESAANITCKTKKLASPTIEQLIDGLYKNMEKINSVQIERLRRFDKDWVSYMSSLDG